MLTCFVIELTPGPNMAYLAVLSASTGRRAGFAATAGVALGLLIVGLAAALGLAALIASSRPLYEALRWAGVFYLFWLAWEGWRGEDTSPIEANVIPDDSRFFLRGLVTNLLNPKGGHLLCSRFAYLRGRDAPTDRTGRHPVRGIRRCGHRGAFGNRHVGRCRQIMVGGSATQCHRSSACCLCCWWQLQSGSSRLPGTVAQHDPYLHHVVLLPPITMSNTSSNSLKELGVV